MMTSASELIYQFKVSLDEIHPPVWRRLHVPASMRLSTLHEALQITMGWEDYHLHSYAIHGVEYTDPALDEGELGMEDEGLFELRQVIHKVGQRFTYKYDFGDGWKHTIRFERMLPSGKGTFYPRCVEGERACPPEDVGGTFGYAQFLEAIGDPDHPEHRDYLRWIGGAFDPEAFELQGINTRLDDLIRDRGAEPFGSWLAKYVLYIHAVEAGLPDWPRGLSEDLGRSANASPLRRDAVALLTYLRANAVRGTQAKGNLTLKAVRDIAPMMAAPPALEDRIGEHVYPIRNAAEVPTLYFVHALSWVAGLAAGGPGQRWRVTTQGEEFLGATAAEQVWTLFKAWWLRANWARLSHIGFPGDFVPHSFQSAIADHLLDLPVSESIAFKEFADQLIEDTGWVYPIEDQKYAQLRLRNMVEDTVIDPLAHLGVLRPEYVPYEDLGPKFRRLSAFELTPLGEALLETLP
jgi:hypothetical protein